LPHSNYKRNQENSYLTVFSHRVSSLKIFAPTLCRGKRTLEISLFRYWKKRTNLILDISSSLKMAQMITPGLVKELLRPGMGIPVRQGDTVTVECTGYLHGGAKFWSTRDPGQQPFSFRAATGSIQPAQEENFRIRAWGDSRLGPGSVDDDEGRRISLHSRLGNGLRPGRIPSLGHSSSRHPSLWHRSLEHQRHVKTYYYSEQTLKQIVCCLFANSWWWFLPPLWKFVAERR